MKTTARKRIIKVTRKPKRNDKVGNATRAGISCSVLVTSFARRQNGVVELALG